MAYGDHIYVERGVYEHHGLDLGDGAVIDFAAREGGKAAATIRSTTLEDFAQSGCVKVRAYGARFTPEDSVARARSMLGCSGYDLFGNNCEHFASWCVTGEHASAQVEEATSAAGFVGVATVGPRVGVRA
jgi:hypothetical protein